MAYTRCSLWGTLKKYFAKGGELHRAPWDYDVSSNLSRWNSIQRWEEDMGCGRVGYVYVTECLRVIKECEVSYAKFYVLLRLLRDSCFVCLRLLLFFCFSFLCNIFL